ncbi:hypothetical protein OGR47_19875 (plasmid) [Methylocystis sp. MJC1]|jgi:hypothetical protein|uniref:hypothetical protein n=1 Tax=Methylocystis sp. MJC1 TaxID=2654282 RepID=UPI0013ED54AB|nr:hypothetical protein [Methylocystis sp. MJC1]KAF2991493.1 hypothetical protein MJC1_01481 [Methylocystis sp. MJC1]MBU6529193.1 hypothetical protein [Methylocystis sp. MJC1]UZX13873.1 hypothetical protein OGR47_19875 [Methylocystis sp. MJC1]
MNTPHVVGFDATDNQGQAIHLTVSTDIVDYFEATRVFGREDLADPGAHGRFQPRLIAIPDRGSPVSSPMVFSIGNQNDLFLVRRDDRHEGGWTVIGLSDEIAARIGGTAKVRALGAAATDDDRITVAFAVDDGLNSRVFVAYDLSSKTTEWDKVPWIDCGVRNGVQIEGVRVLDNGDKSWTIVLAGQNGPNEAVYLLQSGSAHSFAEALVFNPAVTLEEILDFAAGVHPIYGSGLHVLGVSGGERVLAFRPFPVYDSSGNPTTIPPIVALPCPAGANVLDTGPTGSDGADLYIGGRGAAVITAAELDNAATAKVTQAISPAIAANVQKLVAAVAPDGGVALWALELDGNLTVARKPSSGAFGEPLKIRSNVQEIAAVSGDRHVTTSLLVVYGDSQAAFLWQDAAHKTWQESPLTVADPTRAAKVTCYGTSVQTLDGGSVGRPGLKVKISASALASVVLNGSAAFIGPNIMVETQTDAHGRISLYDRVRSLTPATYRVEIDGVGVYDVNPAGGAHQRFQSITADELRAATVPTAGGSEPLLPPEFQTGDKRGQVDVVAGSLNHAAALASGTNGVGAGVRQTTHDAAFSSALHIAALPNGYQWGVHADANGVTAASGDVISKLIGAAEKVETFFVGLGESIADFFEGVGRAIEQGWTFVIHKAEDAVRFICAVGDEVKHFVLNTLEEVGSFFTWLWSQVKTGLERLWEFLKFLFDWEDILRVRDVMLDIVDETFDHAERSIGDMKAPVAKAFDDAIATIDGWRKAAGAPPAVIAKPPQGSSFLDEIESATKPIQELMDLATGNSVVAWASKRFESVLGEIISFDGPNPFAEASDAAEKFFEGLLSDEVSDLEQTLNAIGADLRRLFDGNLPSPRDLSIDTLRAALIAVGADAVDGLLRGVRDLVLRLLDLAQGLVKAARDVLMTKVRLPFIEDLVKLVTGGRESIDTSFSFAGALLLLGAIPATITYKLATHRPLYAKGEIVSLPFGQVTVQSGADAAAISSATLDMIVADIKGALNGFQAPGILANAEPNVGSFVAFGVIPQWLGAVNEIISVSLRSKHTEVTNGLDSTCCILSTLAAVKTSVVAGIVFKDPSKAEKADNANRVVDAALFVSHLALKLADAGILQDAAGGCEEAGDKLAMVGFAISKWVKGEFKAGVVVVSGALRSVAAITSWARFGIAAS